VFIPKPPRVQSVAGRADLALMVERFMFI
jgi:hypothetical protein